MIKKSDALRTAMEASMGKIGYALHCLLTRVKINWNWKLKPEEKLSIEFADKLRQLTLQYHETAGKEGLRAVWCHVPNEGKRSVMTAIIMKAMGMLPGSFDFWFIWEGGGGMIEIKCGNNKLQENQEYFELWAYFTHTNKAVHRSVEGALEALRQWGALC